MIEIPSLRPNVADVFEPTFLRDDEKVFHETSREI